jgi:hypothetical protein
MHNEWEAYRWPPTARKLNYLPAAFMLRRRMVLSASSYSPVTITFFPANVFAFT